MNTRISHLRPLIVAFALVVCTPLFAQQDDATAKTDTSPLAGSWKWDRAGLDGDVRCQLRITDDDGELAGNYEDAEGTKASVSKASLDGDAVSVVLVFEADGKKSEVTLNGRLDKDKIVGEITYSGGPQEWTARRFVSLADAVGQWQLDFTTPDGQNMQPEFELTSKDGEPVVEFSSDDDDPSADGEISNTRFKNGYLIFEMKLVFQDQPLALEYELEIIGDQLEGLLYFQVGDDEMMTGEIEIEGTRIK